MGKKRTHAETKDGFTKPEPDTGRLSAKNEQKKAPSHSQLVCAGAAISWQDYAY